MLKLLLKLRHLFELVDAPGAAFTLQLEAVHMNKLIAFDPAGMTVGTNRLGRGMSARHLRDGEEQPGKTEDGAVSSSTCLMHTGHVVIDSPL